MSTDPPARQTAIAAAHQRGLNLRNPYEVVLNPELSSHATITDRARWDAFEEYRENVMDSHEGEFDDYSDKVLQECAEDAANEAGI